jgi:hypothetical protein
MTVQELIEKLEKIEDKTVEVFLSVRTDIADDFEIKDVGDAVYLVG